MILHYGFEKPTPEIMAAWGEWFKTIGDKMQAQGHFPKGAEFSKDGDKDLPMAANSITGYNIISAADLDEAKTIAKTCPYIDAIRVYEIMSK